MTEQTSRLGESNTHLHWRLFHYVGMLDWLLNAIINIWRVTVRLGIKSHGQRGASKGQEWRNKDVDDTPYYPFEPLWEPTEFLWVINFKSHWCIQKNTPRAFFFIISTWIISTIIVLQQRLGNCCNTSKRVWFNIEKLQRFAYRPLLSDMPNPWTPPTPLP